MYSLVMQKNVYFSDADVPVIISGERLAYMEPQEKVWPEKSGRSYCIRNIYTQSKLDSLAPFEGVAGFSSRDRIYPGTLFRFPLRNAPSELSENLYTVQKLRTLLVSLRDEANFLLLFLRSVQKIEVYEISPRRGQQKLSFQVVIREKDDICHKRERFMNELKTASAQAGPLPYCITRSIDMVTDFHLQVTDFPKNTPTASHWLVANQVGSQTQRVLDTAAKQHVFPWVGVALELSDDSSLPTSSGRIFCFLPMPIEASSPLPVHVNGTFGLNDDRRTLKWPTVERQNDTAADWNKLLVSELLPSCYAKLLMEAKKYLSPQQFYEAWPVVDVVKVTPWEGLLLPFFKLLFNEAVLWTRKEGAFGGQWIVQTQGTFIKQGSALSPVVHKVLSNCGIKLVEVPGMIWDALTYTEVTVHLLSPSTARKALRSHCSTYQDCDPGSKLELLTYCLSDKNCSALNELALLPLADGSFVYFEPNWSSRRVKTRYVCSDKYPRDLLPNIDELLVDLPDNPELQASLQEVASSQQTQLQNLSVQLVAQLLPQCFPSEWQTLNCVSLISSSSHVRWLERFWRWVQPYSLSYFTGLLVLPLTSEGKQGFQVTRLTQHSTVVYISEYCPSQLLRALTKLQVRYTHSDEFSYLHHRDLFSYLNRCNSGGVCTALLNAWYINVSQLQTIRLTPVEAHSLQLFLSTGSSMFTTSHMSVLQNLPVFSVLNQTKLYSVAEAKQKSWRGNAVLEPDNFDISEKYLPQNLVIFSRSQNQRSLLSGIVSPNRIAFVLSTLLPMISNGAYPDAMLDSLMEEILHLSPIFTSQFPSLQNELAHQISNLAFLHVNPYSSVRKPPNQLFDPSKEDLKELFKGEEKFPINPFNQHLQILRKYGLRQTVTGKEIVAIINSISTKPSTSPQKVSSEHVSRAKAVLKYLSANPSLLTEKVSLSSTHFCPLLQALQTLAKQKSWLPVYSTPPRSYSKCLVWKGRAYTSYLASLGAPVLLCNSDDIKTLSLVVGSQMFLVQCSSSEICSLLNTTATVPSHAVAHLQHVIKHSPEIEAETIGEMVYYIYRYLNKYLSELDDDLSSLNWIWIESQHTFVNSDVVAIERSSSFYQDVDPYLYILPNELQRFSKLFTHFGVEQYFTTSQILSVLKRIKDKKATDRHAWSIVMSILNWLTDHGQKPADVSPEDLYVPVESQSGKLELMKARDVIYTDIDFLQNYLTSDSEDSYTFVHHHIHPGMARNLGVTPLSVHLDISEDAFEDSGQHEPLAMRIKNILKDYKDGLTIVKELLQNADDAEATEVNICYDARTHKIHPKSLLYTGMAECHGPALIVHNDAVFTEDDFKNITKLAGATKMDQPLKIGKFGVGFCSVYHITDVPSFVSCEFLYIFDPTLKYLRKVVKDSARPGKRLRFTEKIVASSKQLAPYTGLYSFNSKTYYNGTIFRFPFRSSPSEISHITYNEAHIKQLVTDIQNAGSKLLMFLRNVQRITFSRIDEKDTKTKLVMEVRKKNIPQSFERLLPIFQVESTSLPEEYWLVASHSDTIDSDNGEKYATASVACLLEKKSTRHCYNQQFPCYLPKPIKGEVFCFLPLTLQTGLPVHVSSNFAINTDRRGIRSSDDESRVTDEVQWNIDLMQYIIPKAYQSLLKVLHCMCENENIQEEDYKFYSLWPLKDSLKTHNPWDSFVQPLYTELASSELFFSESTAQWLMLSDSKFLGPHILCHPTPQCVVEVMEKLHQPIVHLPAPYQQHLSPYIESYTIDEEDFLEIFFDNIDSLKKIRNKVLHCLLHAFAVDSTSRKENLQEYLQNKKCIPCTPRGKELKKCSELIDPSVYFAKLYDPEEGVFPIKEFHSNKLINTALIQLKMISSFLPWKMLTERAKTIHKLYTKDRHKALERVRLLIKCIKNNISQSSYDSEIDNLSVEVDAPELATANFLPVMQKPSVYPLTWYGDSYDLLSPCELLHGEHNVLLAGSEAPIICESKPKEGGCGPIPPSVISFLGIQTCATTDIVIKQLHQLIDTFSSQQPQVTTGWTERTSSHIYTFLETRLSENQEKDLSELQETNSVWTGEEFVSPKVVAITWDHNGPYLFRLTDILKHKTNLVATLNIQECFSPSDFLRALHGMHNDFGSDPVDSKCQKLIPTLVNELTSTEDLPTGITCYLPDTSFAMCEASELAYNDAKWCEIDEDYTFVNDIIPRESAIKLGVKPVRSKLLEQYESSFQHFAGVEFGQRELLTQRIKNILREYPFDITVLKELLQNADDSESTKMYVVLDKRSHGKKKLPSSNWKDLQGPSLLVWNDSVFNESDLKGIQQLGLGSKRSDAETIGQYGIGFNVVYHLTDCPSFLTNGDTLCVLDPHCRYVPGASALTPGRRYDKLDEKFWLNWADLQSAYLQESIPGCPAEMKGGSLFRFPLRCTSELMKQSELVDDTIPQAPLSSWKMEQNLRKWAPDMKDALIFLNHVTELKFFEITDSERKPKMQLTDHFKVKIDQAAVKHRTQLHKKASGFTRGSEACVITYPIELIDTVAKETSKWLIQQGVGDIDCDESTWMFTSRVKPKHGIAAPLTSSGTRRALDRDREPSGFRGKIFCFLPLPLSSYLPVHVNGNFILDASRRDLWHPTIKDKPDDRMRWNQELMEAIASSYADFLVKCQSSYVLPSIYQSRSKMWDDIQHYYKVFPRWLGNDSIPDGELLRVAKMVYEKLSTQNAMILAIIKKLPAASKSHSSSSKHKFQIEWHPLVNKKQPSKQAYFWYPATQQEIAPVLESIGMHLAAAPMTLHRHFSNEEIELIVASQDSVYKYYTMFYHQVTPTGHFPCHISETAFQSVKNFKLFTNYLLRTSTENRPQSQSQHTFKEFPKPPFNLPLLLTADGQLRVFTESEKVINSHFSQLFPECVDKFLHPDMLEMRYVPTYFQQCTSDNWSLVSSILSATLPNALHSQRVENADEHVNLLKPLWQCLAFNEIFASHLEPIVREWALLPSTSSQLFSFRSEDQLLPIVPVDSVSTTPRTIHEHVFKIFQQIGMPILDENVVTADQCRPFCPCLSEPQRILTNLYYLHTNQGEGNLSSLLTDRSVDAKICKLFEYLKQIHFANDEPSLHKIKFLPLFKNIDGNFCTLLGDVYIWPGHICMAGSEIWLRQSHVVFLEREGVWNKLAAASVLGITDVSTLEVYTKFIFPQFQHLSDDDQLKQLQYIRDQLFSSAVSDSKMGEFDEQRALVASEFIAALKQLPCLLEDGILKPVCEFCDPKVSIFVTFKESFSFPPDKLSDDKWLEFFRKIGLHTEVTQEEFLEFCNKVSNGDHENLKKASSVLLHYLFQFKEWCEDYEFLSQVSDIPFVCVENLPKLNWIRPIFPAENRIQQGTKTTDLARLCNAAVFEFRELVWTVKPVVKVPSISWYSKNRKKAANFKTYLGINTPPTISEVVQNVYNISETRFSKFDLFDKYSEDCKMKKKDQSEAEETPPLLGVMVNNFEYLKNNHSGEDLRSSLDKLCDATCIPVCVEGKTSGIRQPVLVAPLQVIASDTEELKQFHPLLNPLPDDLYSVVPGVLSVVGVQRDIHLGHIRFALETASKFRRPLDHNIASTVRYLLRKLYHLLQIVSPTTKPSLSPLYLPSIENQLVDSTQLLYHDTRYFEDSQFDFSEVPYSLFSLLASRMEAQKFYRFTHRQFCQSLPPEVCPKALLECCRGELHENCIDSIESQLSEFVKRLQKSFALPIFPKAACAILKSNFNEEELSSQFADSLKIFLQNTQIFSVRNLQSNLLLKLVEPPKRIGTAKVDFLLQRNEESISLYIDAEAHALQLNLFELLTSAIVSCVAEIGGIDVKSLKQPDLAISHLLKAETAGDVSRLLEDLEVHFAISDVEMGNPFDPNLKPKLGSPIPESWHHRLQLDINNIFRPEEWVGYEVREDHIIFALVAHRIVSDEQSSELKEDELLDQYLIYTCEGDEEGKSVCVIELHKILWAKISQSESEEAGTELVLFDPDSDTTQVWNALKGDEFRKEICTELRRIWKLPEVLRRKAIKALYLKWHPDKNDHPLATKAFQFLQCQIARLHAGKPLQDPEDEDAEESAEDETTYPDFSWRYWFHMWDYIAKSHRRAREYERMYYKSHGYGDGSVLGGFYTRPKPDQTTAVVWIRQAEADLKTLQLLQDHTNHHPQVCAHVCFLAHEIAEKALKAGMYAVCGLHPESLRYHDLDSHAGALQQERPALTIGLRAHVSSLRKHYLKSRFPNQYHPHTSPSDVYTQDQARDAKQKAEMVFEVMKEVLKPVWSTHVIKVKAEM